MDKRSEEPSDSKRKRCEEWLRHQNDPKKQCLQNKNDIQFIIETNAIRKKFLLSVADDDATVPAGIEESAIEPKKVPLVLLRKHNLRMECEWQSCQCIYQDYELFQKHVAQHISDIHTMDVKGTVHYVCLWDVCGHSTVDYFEMVRHINYHAYHARLLAIGFNGRATLKMERCKKDSSKRNVLPKLETKHCCMWVGCSESFNAIQNFLDHVKLHVIYSENNLCSWAGCGAVFPKRTYLTMHVRSHTGERLIACFHCGHHFACNRKLCDHLLRQNVHPSTGFPCSMCGIPCASEYLMREHERQHVSAYACALCDMSLPSHAALAQHVRYRHLAANTRMHKCPHCDYRAVTKWDLRKHIPTHSRKKKKKKQKKGSKDEDEEDEENENSDTEEEVKEKKEVVKKKYACHLCSQKEVKIFSRGSRLTTHLVKVHGAQWPFGHSRFRYQISEDGMYRLTTTRFEFEDVSKKIVDGRGAKKSLTNKYQFDLKQTADATETTPTRFEITLKNKKKENENNDDDKVNDSTLKNVWKENENDDNNKINNESTLKNIKKENDNNDSDKMNDTSLKNVWKENENNDNEKANNEITSKNMKEENENNDIKQVNNEVEIMMCDVDDKGNIINSETITDIIYGQPS